jgi:hypothetical protein
MRDIRPDTDGSPKFAASLQVPLVPFSHQEMRIALLHLEKHKSKAPWPPRFSLKTHTPKPAQPATLTL